jgi:hypothetical protein
MNSDHHHDHHTTTCKSFFLFLKNCTNDQIDYAYDQHHIRVDASESLPTPTASTRRRDVGRRLHTTTVPGDDKNGPRDVGKFFFVFFLFYWQFILDTLLMLPLVGPLRRRLHTMTTPGGQEWLKRRQQNLLGRRYVVYFCVFFFF